jgi:hypothetical protein
MTDSGTFRPRVLPIVAIASSIGLVLLAAVFWLALPPHLKVLFTWPQRLGLLAILAFLVAVMWALAASYVRADDQGLRIRNALRTHVIAWQDVHKIVLRPGDPWAIALITPRDGQPMETAADAERRGLMGIQSTDGERARRAVLELRRRQADAAVQRE